MSGTAILFQDEHVTFIEDIDISVYQEIKEQCGCKTCNCKLESKIVNLGAVSPVYWHPDDVDWDYGY
ncbi:hypothetical protein [Neobacillus muris]|uniref:hypothetical protein n=1 Tax=Neobacillus muris TaxID=2941334 RepID=UPI00203C5881|nr:hypothetical protein [Neobacillus muris]